MAGHLNGLAAIEESGVASHQLGRNRRERHVVAGENDRVVFRDRLLVTVSFNRAARDSRDQ